MLSAGLDGKDNGVGLDGGDGTGRDGNCQRERFFLRDGTVKYNGADFDDGWRFVDGTGRRDQFDDGFTVASLPPFPSRPHTACFFVIAVGTFDANSIYNVNIPLLLLSLLTAVQ